MKPTCKLIGEDTNIFNLIGKASKALKNSGLKEEAIKMTEECFKAESFDGALRIIMKYVDVE